MKFGEVEKIHKELCQEARSLSRKKGHDYSGEEDTLKNLKNTERIGICKSELGVLVRIQDKISRLVTLLQEEDQKVEDESIKDTELDVINYIILLEGLRREKIQEKDTIHFLDGSTEKVKQ